MQRFILFSLCIALGLLSCKSPTHYSQDGKKIKFLESSSRIAFYNLENLFDTEDHPEKPDEEFTPEGRNKWTNERYQAKLEIINKVFSGMQYPAFIGVCEVENELVLRDLISLTGMKNYNYGVVHKESPDYRGIDVGFLYNRDVFTVLSSDIIRIHFPKAIVEDYTTRDILQISGILGKKDSLHFFINHWPSRRGGVRESEPKRVYVAEQLRQRVDVLFAQNPSSNIVIMGDFNDETDNRSIASILNAKSATDYREKAALYNLFDALDADKQGTYNFRGNWNMLDQIIVSTPLVSSRNKIRVSQPAIFKADFMIYESEKYGSMPSRTYGGPNYYGGPSDHFPIFVELKK